MLSKATILEEEFLKRGGEKYQDNLDLFSQESIKMYI